MLQPKFPPKEGDFIVALEDWEADTTKYENQHKRKIDDEDKRAVIMEQAPSSIRQHLALHISNLRDYAALRAQITTYPKHPFLKIF